jgi:uncharacterized protein YdaU (DUF1376 family)
LEDRAVTKDTKPDVWFPLVVGDYLKDTSRLTTEQHGAYLLLLMDYWVDGPPPDDDVALAAITRLDAKRWKATRPAMLKFFRIEDGVWRQKRADEEKERWTERKRKFTERAAAGGRGKAASSTASSSPQAGKSGPQSLLKSCTSSSSTEVDGPTGHSTLCDQISNSDLKEDLDTEREWGIDKVRAEGELVLARRQDPDQASELEEFIQVAKDRMAELRRSRLSLVAA